MPALANPLRLALVLVVACGGPSTPPASSASPTMAAAGSAAASVAPTSAASPAATTARFLRTLLTDVRSGERFMLGGFIGKTVIVQGMAVW